METTQLCPSRPEATLDSIGYFSFATQASQSVTSQDGLIVPVKQPGPGEGSLSNQGYLNNWSNSPEKEGHGSTSQLGVEMQVEVSGYSRNC